MPTDLSKISVDQYDLNGSFVKSYSSIHEAAAAVEREPHQIHRALPGTKNPRITCASCYWRRTGQSLGDVEKLAWPGRPRTKIQLRKKGQQPRIFPSQMAAARALGVPQSNISIALNKQGTCRGYEVKRAA